MSIFSKLAFWKKDDNFNSPNIGNFGTDSALGEGPNLGLNQPDSGFAGQDYGQQQNYNYPDSQFGQQMPSPQFGQQMPASQFGQAPAMFPGLSQQYQQTPPLMPQQSQDMMMGKDIEVISAKLDSLRVYLDSINQRLANIERIAMNDQEKRRGW